MRFLGFFSVAILASACATQADEAVGSSADPLFARAYRYDVPGDWNVHAPDDGPSPGAEPLNVILTGDSNVPLNTILSGLSHVVWGADRTRAWISVEIGTGVSGAAFGACISPETGTVWPDSRETTAQAVSLRIDGCSGIASWGEDHARMWLQATSGAAFLALSREHPCLMGIRPWHCIDDDGYDTARDAFVADLTKAGENQGWEVTCVDVARPAGVGLNDVSFGGTAKACRVTKR